MVSRETLARAISGGVAAAALTVGGVGLSAGGASAQPRDPWNAIAQCESGGNWHIDTGNGYYGGLQFSPATWSAYGGHGSAANASRAEQIRIGKRVAARQGWSAWSSCSARLGLSGRASSTDAAVAGHVDHVRPHRPDAAHRTVDHPHVEHPGTHAKQPDHRPAGGRHAATRVGRHVAVPAVSKATYTVRPGDTLQAIAAHFRIVGGWQALADANAAHVAHPALIVPAQVLHLPAR